MQRHRPRFSSGASPISIPRLIPANAHQEEAENIFQRVRAGERIDHVETVRLTKSGKRVDVSLTISPLVDADGRMVGFANIYRDISDQKRAQEALAGLNRTLLDAHEQERSRIARELHDDIAQRLVVLAFDVEDLVRGSTTVPAFHHKTLVLRDRASGEHRARFTL